MHDVHFRSLDLNLLRVFAALFAERSATQAGRQLGLSQSAVSHALGRLRQALSDELFLRDPAGLVPTPRAIALAPAVADAMTLLEAAVSPPRFDPGQSDRQFTIGATAYVCTVLLPGLIRRFNQVAPRARLRVRSDHLVAEELDRGRLDAILGAFEIVPDRFDFVPLFDEDAVWVIRHDHPALRTGSDVGSLAGLGEVTVTPDEPDLPVSIHRHMMELKRQIAWTRSSESAGPPGSSIGRLTVPDTYSALAVVLETDMIALLPKRLATRASQKRRLMLIEPSPGIPPIRIGAVVRTGSDAPVAWLLDLMRSAAQDL